MLIRVGYDIDVFRWGFMPNSRHAPAAPGVRTIMFTSDNSGAWQRTHPMSGGIKRVRLDGIDDFLSLRKESYGLQLDGSMHVARIGWC